jgi:hypothetical protein
MGTTKGFVTQNVRVAVDRMGTLALAFHGSELRQLTASKPRKGAHAAGPRPDVEREGLCQHIAQGRRQELVRTDRCPTA